MRPSVRTIEGGHLTATDKRNIVDGIVLLKDTQDWDQWVCRKGSPKRYQFTPDPDIPNRFEVAILENYRTDWGEKSSWKTSHLVDVCGLEPKQTAEQLSLF